jgi:hypothetical protein
MEVMVAVQSGTLIRVLRITRHYSEPPPQPPYPPEGTRFVVVTNKQGAI